MNLSVFIDCYEKSETVCVMEGEEIVFEGEAAKLKKLLTAKVVSDSCKKSDKGTVIGINCTNCMKWS